MESKLLSGSNYGTNFFISGISKNSAVYAKCKMLSSNNLNKGSVVMCDSNTILTISYGTENTSYSTLLVNEEKTIGLLNINKLGVNIGNTGVNLIVKLEVLEIWSEDII